MSVGRDDDCHRLNITPIAKASIGWDGFGIGADSDDCEEAEAFSGECLTFQRPLYRDASKAQRHSRKKMPVPIELHHFCDRCSDDCGLDCCCSGTGAQ